MPNNDKIVNDKIDHKSIIESTRTYKEAVRNTNIIWN